MDTGEKLHRQMETWRQITPKFGAYVKANAFRGKTSFWKMLTLFCDM